MNTLQNIVLVAWDNGVMMIGVFALVVIFLIAAVMALMNSGKNS
ncbi:MAG: hypothetical protein AAGC45_10210 [Bacteroidota bacterium]